MCSFLGCVLAAMPGRDRCNVHLAAQMIGAPTCPLCQGTGSHYYASQKIRMACVRCGGTGICDRRRKSHAAVPKKKRTPVDERGLIKASES